MNILLVDDEPLVRKLTKLFLGRRGHQVSSARNGAEALVLLTESSTEFDLLITDHEMLKVHGLELVRQLNGKEFHGEVVVWSGALDSELHERYEKLGVRQCLSKPVSVEEITRIVDEVADELAA